MKALTRAALPCTAVLLAVLTGCGSSASVSSPPPAPPASAPTPTASVTKWDIDPSFNATDLAWIELMIPMDEQLLRVLGLAEKQAADPAVKKFATEVAAGHKTELAQFVALRARSRLPVRNPHEGHDMPGMMTEPEIVTLGGTKDQGFDPLFEKNLQEHLDQSIVLARSITTDGKDAATKKLAASIIATRTTQLQQLAGL
ncbi:DUF305 domain-containing protein [Streptomyces sp. SID13031]|uniref:DUF305 domain-containing protein n=1 Tax=Streptomyces sp. SID13031 TaxID=2706046 RepID=UPI0013C64499|nr:DUF305 domain-containing protein [Streptomyces sp. SID13031]NEA37172.1 DUF305 domain-containing protein [Streptomyces sp. SID13031]